MSGCSNPRCSHPNAGPEGRCFTCNSLLVGQLIRDRYLVQSMVSRGGFGATYLVHDGDCFDEPRILKELRPATSDGDDDSSEVRKETAERLFKREAKTLLGLNHSGIPKLYAYFVQKNFSYLLQEYIPGKTLAEAQADRGDNLNEAEARALLIEISDILKYLHSKDPSIVHRDIKPQNLMRHEDGRLLLIDFGAVCRAANQQQGGQTLIGSPGYAPPEQIMGQPVPQSDLYAAGVTIVRLITGIHPIQLTNKRSNRIEWERHVIVTPQFRDLINELLVRDPQRRLSSALELLSQLQSIEAIPPMPSGLFVPFTESKIDEATSTALASTVVGANETILENLNSSSQLSIIVPGIITALGNNTNLERGSLSEMPVPALLFRCYHNGASGMLNLVRNGVTKTIHFEQGSIIFANSSQKEERLSEYLLRLGRLSPADFERATKHVDETGQRMGSTLLQMGIITIEELTPLVVEHVSHLVYSIFEWIEGQYEFIPRDPISQDIKMPFSTADIIFEGIRRLDNLELIKQWLGSFTRRLCTTSDPLLLYQSVTIYPQEAYIVSRIDSAMSIEELLSLGGLSENETIRCVCGLLAIGMLESAEIAQPAAPQQSKQASAPVASVLAQPNHLPQEVDFSTAAAFCYEVESKLRNLENSDAYAILEITRNASDNEITEAYQNLARKYHPDRHSQLLNYNLSLRGDLDRIFKVIATAYDMLSSKEKRNQYNSSAGRTGKVKVSETRPAGIERPVEKKPVANASPFAVPTNFALTNSGNSGSFSEAEKLHQRGQREYHNGQYEAARISFEKAVALEPQNAAYHFALARALAHIAGGFQPAEIEFYRALELAPHEADYYAEFGLFYQRLNLPDRAENMFSYCLKIAPAHPVALRSIKNK